MIFQGTLDDLKQKQQQSLSVVFETSDEAVTREAFARNSLNASFKDGKFSMPALPKEQIARINRELVDGGVEVFEISVIKNDLETIFIDMVRD